MSEIKHESERNQNMKIEVINLEKNYWFADVRMVTKK